MTPEVSVLSEALPYIQRFAGRRIVIKYGGLPWPMPNCATRCFATWPCWPAWVFNWLWFTAEALKSTAGLNDWRFPQNSRMGSGHRRRHHGRGGNGVVGRVNKQIVNGLNQLGARAVGLSGSDGSLVEARPWGDGSHGLVGDVARVNPDVLEPLLERGYVPVISSVAATTDGRSHNINADTVAGEIAASLEAEKLILLTDTPGILRDRNEPESLIRKIRLSEARQLIEDGVVAGGMTPKTECCIRALAQGVSAAHIVDGRVPHALLLEVFTDAGIGTMVVGRG